jgi:hypothetical protein
MSSPHGKSQTVHFAAVVFSWVGTTRPCIGGRKRSCLEAFAFLSIGMPRVPSLKLASVDLVMP